MGKLLSEYNASEVNGAAVVTLPALTASPSKPRIIQGFMFSYSATPPADSSITITSGGETFGPFPVTTEGPGPVVFPPLEGVANESMVCTLSTGGSGVRASLYVFVVQ